MKRFLKAASLLSLVFLALSCENLNTSPDFSSRSTPSQGASPSGTTTSEELCSFTVSVKTPDGTIRAAVPTYSTSSLYYTFTSQKGSDTAVVTPSDGSAEDYDTFIAHQFTLAAGTYTLTVCAYSDSSCSALVLKASSEVELSSSTTTVPFTLAEPAASEASTGSISIKFAFPVAAGINLATASLYASSAPTVAVDSDRNLPLSSLGDTMYATYTYNGVAAGLYILRLKVTNNDGYETLIPQMVKVASGITSEVPKTTANPDGVISLTAKDINTRYSITYNNMDDGAGTSYWASGAVVSASFVEGQSITLPTLSDVSYSDHMFFGWYEDSAFSGEAVTSFTGGSEAKTLYARWVSCDLYVSAAGSDSADGLSSTTAVPTITTALEKQTTLASTYGTSFNWTIHVSGEIEENSKVPNTLSAQSLQICGTSNATDILNGNGENSVLIIQTTVPITLKNLTITNGSASYGGGLYLSGSTVCLSDGVIINANTASTNGGGIYNNGTLYICGSAIIGASSASTVAEDGDAANSAGGNGGGISNSGTVYLGYSGKDSSGTLIPASFTGGIYRNYATSSGGGIYSSGIIITNGGSVNYNTAGTGGGISLYDTGSSAVLSDTVISANSASTHGGGLYNSAGTVFLTGSAVIGSLSATTAPASGSTVDTVTAAGGNYSAAGGSSGEGGGIYSSGGSVYLGYTDADTPETSFSGGICGNYSAKAAGGVSLRNAAQLYMAAGNLSYNRSVNGGGGVKTGESAGVTVHDGTVAGNCAGGTGGGIYVGSSESLTMEGGTISGNEGTNGGGVYNNGGTVTVSGGTICANSAAYGGGIYSKGTLTMTSGIIGNEDSGLGNYASDSGAGICIAGGGSATISGTSSIINNYAEYDGGGINVQDSDSTFTMESGTVTGNYADWNGGGICISNQGAVATIKDVTFSNNTTNSSSSATGGAISLMKGTLTVSDGFYAPSDGTKKVNDIYVGSTYYITIGGNLTATTPVATITPQTYTTGTTILVDGDGSVAANYTKFAVTDDAWSIDSAGKLQEGGATSNAIADLTNVPTDAGTYTLSTLSELETLRSWVNGGNAFSGFTFVLTGDIDLGNEEWVPIGCSSTSDAVFQGTFDGGGYEISGFVPSTSYTYVGFFGIVKAESGSETIIQNLTVSGSSSMVKGGSGSIVGTVSGAGTVTINNCIGNVTYADGTGTTTGYIGGIVGNSTNTGTLNITNCKNYASLTNANSASKGYIGGILGRASGATTNIINCANYGNLTDSTSGRYASGILGYSASAATITIEQCFNKGTISAANDYAIARTYDTTCTATIQYNFYLDGCASNISDATVSNCSAFTGTNSSCVTSSAVTYSGTEYAAGTSVLTLLNTMAGSTYSSWAYNTDSTSVSYGYPDLE